jgi:hypothetical protein
MATQHTLKWVKNVYGGGAIYKTQPEGTSETYKKGAPLEMDASEDGLVELTLSNGVPDNQTIYGIAQEDATNVTSSFPDVDVLIPRPGDIFSCSLASDQDTLVAPTIDHIGDLVGVIKLSTTGGDGTEYVADTGNTNWFKIIDVDRQDVARRGGIGSLSAGDRVWVQFLGAILDSAGSQA